MLNPFAATLASLALLFSVFGCAKKTKTIEVYRPFYVEVEHPKSSQKSKEVIIVQSAVPSDYDIRGSIFKVLYLIPFGQWSDLKVSVRNGLVDLDGKYGSELWMPEFISAISALPGVKKVELTAIRSPQAVIPDTKISAARLVLDMIAPLLIAGILGLALIILLLWECRLIKKRLIKRKKLVDRQPSTDDRAVS